MGKVNSNRSKNKEVCGGSGAAQLTGKKRKNEGTLLANKDVNAKRSKKVAKKVCSQRLEYEEEEEISVLQGILDCYAVTGKSPFVNMKETFEFMKEYTNLEYFDEYVEKMNSLKKQLMGQRRRHAKELSFSDSYYQRISKLLALSSEDDVGSAVEKPKRSKRVVKPKEEKQAVMSREGEKWFENASLVRQVVIRGVDEDSLKSKWDAVPTAKKNKMDQKWRVLRAKERESMPQKSKFFKELVSVIVGASSSSRFM